VTAVAQTTRPSSLLEQVADRFERLRLQDAVLSLTLFLAVVFPFAWWPCPPVAQIALLTVLLFPAAIRSPVLWGVVAATATAAVVQEWDLADNHKYLLCYWLWVMCIAQIPHDQAFGDRIIRFNARFFLIFIFLGAALQKFLSDTYMSGAMFEMELLLDSRFHAFAQLVGIDNALTEESLRRLLLLQNPFVEVGNNYVNLLTDEYVHRVATLVTMYDFYVQLAIGALLLFRRRSTDIAAHILLLFFIFTTYIPAPVFGFGIILSVLGFTLAKERLPLVSVAYLLSVVAVLIYQTPWREWVLGT
jgi:hypothetical protein